MPQNEQEIRFGIVQRVLPHYRAPFFDALSSRSKGEVQLFSGETAAYESFRSRPELLKDTTHVTAVNHYLWRGWRNMCWQSGLWEWLQHFKPHVLILEANPRLVSNRLALSWVKRNRRKAFGWGLGVLARRFPKPLVRLRRFVLRAYYGRFDALIAYSSKARGDYVALGIDSNRVYIAHNAVAMDGVGPFLQMLAETPSVLEHWKRTVGLREDRTTVLFVGRLERRKQIHTLIQACTPLREKVQLLIVGEGPERSALEALARQSDLHVVFTGAQYGQDLSYCFCAGDIFVLPGLGGLAIQQAMSYGKPVIAGISDGTEKDLVRNGVNGFLVEPLVPKFSEAIDDLASHPERRDRMAAAAHSIIQNEINLHQMATVFLKCIEDTTKRSQSA